MRGLDGRAAAIEAVDVTCRAGDRTLVHDASVRVMPGELVAVLGPSGSGKTTLLHALAGARAASAGSVRLRGAEASAEQLQRDVALVPQDDVLHLELSPAQALDGAARLRLGGARAQRTTRVEALLRQLELGTCRDVPAARLSGGQRKRLSLALELVGEPAVVVLDEPTANLDPPLQARLVTHLRRLADAGRAVLFSTHQLEHLDACHRVLVLREGRVVFDGTPTEARARLGSDDLSRLLDDLPARPRAAVRMWRQREPRRRHRRVSAVAAALQLPALVRREVLLLAADPRRPALLALQAVFVGLAIAAGLTAPASLLLLLVLAALWCGTSAGARAIVRERAVVLRERRWGVSAGSLLAAKGLVLATLAAVQAALLLGVVASLRDVPGAGAALFAALLGAGVAGALVGVALSAIASTADQANALVPLVLIPQVLLAGPLAADEPLARAAGRLTPARWAYDLAVRVARDAGAGEELVTEDELSARRERLAADEAALRQALDGLAPPRVEALDVKLEATTGGLQAGVDELRAQALEGAEDVARLDSKVSAFSALARESSRHVRDLEAFRRHEGPERRTEADPFGWDWAEAQGRCLLLRDLPLLERSGRELEGEFLVLRERQRALQTAYDDVDRRVERTRVTLEEVEGRVREAVRAVEPARRRLVDVEARVGAIASARDALRRDADDGRVVRLERWGSVRVDAVALLGFALASVGVALAALERARAA